MSSNSDLALVEAAINGDVDSFTELCRRYYPAMVAIAHSLLGDRHLAEDAAQETFAKACRELPRLRKKNRFASWLAVICRNTSRDMAGTMERLCSIEDLSIASPTSEQDVLSTAVKEAISKLPAAAKEIVFLRYYDGMTYEQISAVLGISGVAVNGRLRRAKKKIAEHLRRDEFFEV